VTGREGNYCGVLLAAGRAVRFGSDKLLHLLPGGTPIALASARAMLGAVSNVVAVVREDNQVLIRMLAQEGVEIVHAHAGDKGMGDSLAAGVAATAEAAGWIVGLADMPFIKSSTYSSVLSALEAGAPLAAPLFHRQRGHPVGFNKKFFKDLLALHGDEGARQLLLDHQAEIALIECEDTGTIRDIDQLTDV
jgi:molybdenum cofactor cytidylyltransferase